METRSVSRLSLLIRLEKKLFDKMTEKKSFFKGIFIASAKAEKRKERRSGEKSFTKFLNHSSKRMRNLIKKLFRAMSFIKKLIIILLKFF